MSPRFTDEFRRDVVAFALKGVVSIPQVAIDFGVSERSVRDWIKASEPKLEPVNKSLEAELRAQNKRIRVLEQENEILRRAAAYFASRDVDRPK